MAFIDLRDRQDDPAASALIELVTGSLVSAERVRQRCADRSRVLVGWRDAGHPAEGV